MALSPLIRFGTSTWAYEGWQDLIYKYAEAVEQATPYNRIVQPLPEMRKDTVQLIGRLSPRSGEPTSW